MGQWSGSRGGRGVWGVGGEGVLSGKSCSLFKGARQMFYSRNAVGRGEMEKALEEEGDVGARKSGSRLCCAGSGGS